MIIKCPNCEKQFNIDNSLIPDEGRDLQCGSCNNVWFYKIVDKSHESLDLKDEIVNNDVQIDIEKKVKIEKKQIQEKTITEINKKNKEKNLEKQKTTNISKHNRNKEGKFFSYLIVFIISLAALIILIDTLKIPLIEFFPELEIILFNLFETLKDLKLFIIDLL
tara:strand:+ start:105 stop:596 length:492 start_codon:yes stop_codon:yes gene_type:complete